MYCRTHERRVQLCNEYDIKPIGRFKLLNGKTVISDAGKKILLMNMLYLTVFQKQIQI